MTHAFITGAGSGIGAAISKTLAEQGLQLSLVGRRQDALINVAKSLPGQHWTASCDVTDSAAVAQTVSAATAANGPISILINCAGAAPTVAFHKMDFNLWQQTIDINLNGAYHCIQAVLPNMLNAGYGRIINIASSASQKGYAYVSAYCAAKHAVLGLTRALALEVATKGITVNAVCPSYTDTDIIRGAIKNIAEKTGQTEAQAANHFTQVNPQGRLVSPDEVAAAVQWLASQGAASVNGQAIGINGGEI